MAILNLAKETIFPLWSIFQTIIFLHVISTQNSSKTSGQDAQRDKDTIEREVNPFSSFETGCNHEEKGKSSGDEEYGENTLERKINKMQMEFKKEKEESRQAFGELLGIIQ